MHVDVQGPSTVGCARCLGEALSLAWLATTDGDPLGAALRWEVLPSEGHGPDTQDRITAFTALAA